jgi:hypothetical protein
MYGFVCTYFIFQSAVYAQENLDASIDCMDVQVDYADNPTLTREERIHLMDKALYKSLNKFELCQSAKKMVETNGTKGGNGANGGSGNSGDSSSKTEGTSAEGSVASSTMSGTELPKVSPVPPSANNENSVNKDEISVASGSGKLPEDIPSADNDSALAAQIRHAAENEADPVKKARLWNEYRKYRGLPQK